MKVLKFGGTSVGTAGALQQVKQIVEGRGERFIVVVSALGGVTDQLLAAAAMAERGDVEYRHIFEGLAARHWEVVAALFGTTTPETGAETPGSLRNGGWAEQMGAETPESLPDSAAALWQVLATDLEALRTRLDGVFTLKVLPEKTRGEIVSYGERMSARIVTALIEGARLYDALDFIRTFPQQGKCG